MGIKFPKVKFNSSAFGHTFVGRRAGRWIEATFDGLGKERIIFIVKNNQQLLDLTPLEIKIHYKKQAEQYGELIPRFTDEEVYNWIPVYWREVIESVEGGLDWGMRQVQSIRQYLLA